MIIITSEIRLHMVQSHLNETRVIQTAKTDVHKVPNATKMHFLEVQTANCPVFSDQSQRPKN